MKKLHKAFLLSLMAASLFALSACSDDDDSTVSGNDNSTSSPVSTSGNSDDSGSTTVSASLPESKGTNELSGKKFSVTESDNSTITWEFSDTTAKVTNGDNVVNYRYTYDSTKKIINLVYTSITLDGKSASSVSDFVNVQKQISEAAGKTWTSTMEAYYTSQGTANFSTPDVFKYELGEKTLTLTKFYFSGTLPTTAGFKLSTTNSGYIELTQNSAGRIKIKDNGTKYYGHPTFSNGSFSGTMYKGKGEETAGAIEGTYTTSGTGLSGCTVTLTFTSLPSSITGVETGKAYQLGQSSSEDCTLSLALVE